MNCYRLPGIERIDIVKCAHLSYGMMLKSICGMPVVIVAPHERIEIIGHAELKWDSTKENGKLKEKTTLTFRTEHRLSENERLAFVVTTAGGEQYLIGTREGRYPKIEWEDTTGEAGKTASVRTYKVTHTAQKSVLRCVM